MTLEKSFGAHSERCHQEGSESGRLECIPEKWLSSDHDDRLKGVERRMALAHYQDSAEQLRGMGEKTELAMSPAELQGLFGTREAVEIGRRSHSWLIDSLADKPVIAVVYEGEEVIARIRKLVGYTDPSMAHKGTIRGNYGNDSIARANQERRKVENPVHASDSMESGEREILVWFPTHQSTH